MAEFDEKLNEILNNPQAMGQIMALANSLGGNENQSPAGETGTSDPPAPSVPPAPQTREPPASAALGDLDPRFLQIGMRVLREYQRGDDEKIALLIALRPFLREERYEKLDRAIQIARLSRVIRVLLDAMGRGEDRV